MPRPEITGLVQRVLYWPTIGTTGVRGCCAHIGPSSEDVELVTCFVNDEMEEPPADQFNNIAMAFSIALANRIPVRVTLDEGGTVWQAALDSAGF
jgi:hypothetical protein